jgi:hypothetical protein
MKKCIICGGPTKLDCYNFCEKYFNSPIEELEEKYERKRASRIRDGQQEALSQEGLSEPFSLK